MKKWKQILSVIIIFAVIVGVVGYFPKVTYADSFYKTISITKGNSYTLSIDGQKVKKTSSANNKVVDISNSSKGIIKAKKKGSTTVTLVCTNGKKYKFKVNVKNATKYAYLNNVKLNDYRDDFCIDYEELTKYKLPAKIVIQATSNKGNLNSELIIQPMGYWWLDEDTSNLALYFKQTEKNTYEATITSKYMKKVSKYANFSIRSNNLTIKSMTVVGDKKNDKFVDTKSYQDTPFGKYGALHVEGQNLVGVNGEKFRMVGMLNWYHMYLPSYVNRDTYADLRDNWGINTLRVAVDAYSDGGLNGWEELPRSRDYIKYWTEKKIDYLTDCGMYAMVDWECGLDDIKKGIKPASEFFEYISAKYADHENIIYEIDNEPNGEKSDWVAVKEYANAIIPIIRKNDPDAVIIVGTPDYSSNITAPLNDALPYDNLMYTYHTYITDGYDTDPDFDEWKEARFNSLIEALDGGLPVLVTEFGTWHTGKDGLFDRSFKWWNSEIERRLDYFMSILDKKNVGFVSWIYPEVCIKPDCYELKGWENSDLTPYGIAYKKYCREAIGK